MASISVKELLGTTPNNQEVEINGWVRTFRSNRFIALNDGSTINSVQCVVDFEKFDEALIKSITTGAAIRVRGVLVPSQGRGQLVEIQVAHLDIHGTADPETYPIQPKKHSLEFFKGKSAPTGTYKYFFRGHASAICTFLCGAHLFSTKWVLLFPCPYYNRFRCGRCR